MRAPSPLIWITGAGGLIGHHLVRSASRWASRYRVCGTTRNEIDLTDPGAVRDAFRRLSPSAVIHCAALSTTDLCQKEPALARKTNVEATARLAALAETIPFVFFSTDLVFDGTAGWYDETAQVSPLHVYGETKAEAERIVLANPRHTVIRTSLTAGISPTGDRAFNEQMRRAWQEGRTLRLFIDEFRCPLAVTQTVRAVWELLQLDQPGLYHLAGTERLSRWQIGRLVAERYPEVSPRLSAVSRLDYSGPPRPADTSLNCQKLQGRLSFPLLGLSAWLAAHPDAW